MTFLNNLPLSKMEKSMEFIFIIVSFIIGVLAGLSFNYPQKKKYKYESKYLKEKIQEWDLQELSRIRRGE